MLLGRRTLLAAAIPAITRPAFAAPSPVVRIGTLRFGTVSWEADVIRHHGLDAAAAIIVEIITFATPQAAQVALQSGAVDMVVADWLFVARQRASGADWSFIPFSNAVGALIAPAGSPVRAVPDLVGRTLGVAGTPLDKSWLILRAYAMKRYGIDLRTASKPSFGPPPLLNEQMNLGRLDALLTFWPQAAKAEAAGARRVLAVEDAVAGLGVSTGVPYIGYIFSQAWAEKTPQAISGFITAVQQARTKLATSDAEWQRLKPNTGAVDDAELTRLRDWYRLGIPNHWAQPERAAAAELFTLLAQIGGPELVGPLSAIPAGTFWPVTW